MKKLIAVIVVISTVALGLSLAKKNMLTRRDASPDWNGGGVLWTNPTREHVSWAAVDIEDGGAREGALPATSIDY